MNLKIQEFEGLKIRCIPTSPPKWYLILLYFSFLKSAKEGETIVVESKTVKSGKTLAFLDTVLKNKDTGLIVATGTHVKFIAPWCYSTIKQVIY